MPLTYLERDQLASNENFIARIRTALRDIASYHRNNPGSNQIQKNWSRAILENGAVSAVAAACAGEVSVDPAFANSDATASNVTDSSLKAAVEAVALRYRI